MPYVKTSARTTRAGTVRYLQLAHNEWDPGTQRSRTRVLYNFGREDELDKDAVRRLVAALPSDTPCHWAFEIPAANCLFFGH